MKLLKKILIIFKIMKLWIARELNNSLILHSTKPYYEDGEWVSSTNYSIDSDLFPEVTFENSPQLVEIKLVK